MDVQPEYLEPTGREMSFGGLKFDQMQIRGGYLRGTRFIYRLAGHPNVSVARIGNAYIVTIDGERLKTKFREWHTAAAAIRKALSLPA
jgi:hypothetical protein